MRTWSNEIVGDEIEVALNSAAFNFYVVRIVLTDGTVLEGKEVSFPGDERLDGDNFLFDYEGEQERVVRFDDVASVQVTTFTGRPPEDPLAYSQF